MKMGNVDLTRGMGLAAMVLLLTASSLTSARPKPKLFETQMGKRVATWIAAFNTGDDDTMVQWVAENLASEESVSC